MPYFGGWMFTPYQVTAMRWVDSYDFTSSQSR